MSAADYAAIRARLDHPPVAVHDPCAETLAPDDPDWPAPSWTGGDYFGPGSPRSVGRRVLAAASMVLATFEEQRPTDRRPREALAGASAWLSGEPVTWQQFRDLAEVAFAAAGDAEHHSPPFSANASAYSAILFEVLSASENGDCQFDPHTGFHALDEAMSAAWPWETEQAFMNRWWARCRALLPIADVTTAEIEWGDIELPPKPINGDLPGGGSPGCIEWT